MKISRHFLDVNGFFLKVYIYMRKYLEELEKILMFSNEQVVDEAVMSMTKYFGLDGVDNVDDASKRDNFIVHTVIFAGINTVLERDITFAEYLMFKKDIEMSLANSEYSGSGSLAELMKLFEVDNSLIPKIVKTHSMKINERNLAVNLISDMADSIDPYGIKFSGYEDYYEYVEGKAKVIIEECNSKGYFGIHKLEVFTLILISNIIGMPSIGNIYFVDDKGMKLDFPVEEMKGIQKKVFEKIDEINGR